MGIRAVRRLGRPHPASGTAVLRPARTSRVVVPGGAHRARPGRPPGVGRARGDHGGGQDRGHRRAANGGGPRCCCGAPTSTCAPACSWPRPTACCASRSAAGTDRPRSTVDPVLIAASTGRAGACWPRSRARARRGGRVRGTGTGDRADQRLPVAAQRRRRDGAGSRPRSRRRSASGSSTRRRSRRAVRTSGCSEPPPGCRRCCGTGGSTPRSTRTARPGRRRRCRRPRTRRHALHRGPGDRPLSRAESPTAFHSPSV
jgi:hypothetical protein